MLAAMEESEPIYERDGRSIGVELEHTPAGPRWCISWWRCHLGPEGWEMGPWEAGGAVSDKLWAAFHQRMGFRTRAEALEVRDRQCARWLVRR